MHDKAVYFAAALRDKGFEVKNDVCFNQILLSLGDSASTEKALKLVFFCSMEKEPDSKLPNENFIRIYCRSSAALYIWALSASLSIFSVAYAIRAITGRFITNLAIMKSTPMADASNSS